MSIIVKLKSSVLVAVSAAALAPPALQASATSWPDKPVRLVVGYAPGGSTDILARVIAKELTQISGQPFVVDNQSGANSNIAANTVAKAAPDGYTVLMGTISTAINVSVYRGPGYNIDKDLTAVASIASVPNLLVVNASLPIRSVEDYIRYAKEHPGKLTFASPGIGSSVHLSGELFKMSAGIDVLHVPYRGSGPALTDLLGGQVDSTFDNLPAILPYVQSGKLRALGVTTAKRNTSLPDIVPIAEQGIPGYEAYAWYGLFVPAGTPADVVLSLNHLTSQALAAPNITKQFTEIGATAMRTEPADFSAFVHNEIAKWATVVRKLNIKPE